MHLPIRSRVYFFVADDCQPPTHCSASYLCRVSAGRAVNTRYYKCNDCVIVCIPQVSLICKTGHPHDTSHNRSHSLSHPQPSELSPDLKCALLSRNHCHFLLTLIQNGLVLCTGASLIIKTSAHGVWAIILIILYREAGVGAEGREGRAT